MSIRSNVFVILLIIQTFSNKSILIKQLMADSMLMSTLTELSDVQLSTIEQTISWSSTSNLNITTNGSISISTPPTKSEKNLSLILGLTLGLGIPVSLIMIGGLVYYLKIYRPKQSQVVIINS